MAKTTHKNRRAKKPKHPMSAGAREANGRRQRETTRAARVVVQRCEPTPELLRKLKDEGPTCFIQRAVMRSIITAEQGQAVEAFAALRKKLGLAERNPMPVEGRQQPQAPGRALDYDEQIRAATTYMRAATCLDAIPGAFDAITDLCDQHQPRNLAALQRGAMELARFFVRGEKAA